MKFPFTAKVFLGSEVFNLPVPDESSNYTVRQNVAYFSLGHGESITISCIPIGATVIVEECEYEGFLVFHRLEGTQEESISGPIREIRFSNTPQTIHYVNQSGFCLPNTGGMGTALFTTGGAVLSLGMSVALLGQCPFKGRRKNDPPEE